MTIKSAVLIEGADVHLDASECELLMQLACNAEKVNASGSNEQTVYKDAHQTYFSVSLALGRRLLALSNQNR